MKILSRPTPPNFTYTTRHACGAVIELDLDEIEADKCKKPGTYWFDGSAHAAGLVIKFFAKRPCPVCGDEVNVPAKLIPDRVKRELGKRMK